MVVIPAYNEEATIENLIERVLKQNPNQILVINDASNDQTASILQSMKEKPSLKMIHNSRNLGKAGSLWRGFEQAIEQEMDVVITIDGDGQHRPEDMPALLEKYLHQPEQLVIGAREKNLKTQPLGRFFANRFANFWISWASGYAVKDSQSGFRLYPVKLLTKIDALKNSNGFVFESEVIIELAWQGYYSSVVTIPTIYHQNRRPSHFKAWQDIKKITKMVAHRLYIKRFAPKGLIAALSHRSPPAS